MIILLLPLVAAILFCERTGVLYPEENAAYDSLYIHTFVLSSEGKRTDRCERFEARTYGGKVYLYVLRDSIKTALHNGDTVIAKTRIRRIENFDSFDYRKHLLRQGITGSAFVSRYSVRPTQTYRVPLQKRLYERLHQAGLEGDELATIGALTLGYKEDLDPSLKRRFQASGAAHVLAVSGLHTGIIYALLVGLLTLGGRFKPRYENRLGRCAISLVIISVLWGYARLTGFTPSVVRAVVMISIFEAGHMLYRQTVSMNTIAAAAVLILLVKPLDLWSVGFQLSFAATTAIMAFGTGRLVKKINKQRRVAAYLLGIVWVSVAAQLGTLPITMYYFGYVSTYFLLANLLILPVVTLLVPCGFVSLLLGGSVAGVWFSKLTWALAWFMNHSVGWIESLPGSTLPAHIGLGMVAVYYIGFIGFGIMMFHEGEEDQKSS